MPNVIVVRWLCRKKGGTDTHKHAHTHTHTGTRTHRRTGQHPFGGADRVLPEWIQSGGGGSSRNFPGSIFSGGGGSTRNFPGSILCGWQTFFSWRQWQTLNSCFFPLPAVTDPRFLLFKHVLGFARIIYTLCPNSCRQTARIGGAAAPPAPPSRTPMRAHTHTHTQAHTLQLYIVDSYNPQMKWL